MSRSHKYHSFGTLCNGRNKPYKKSANRKFRRHNNQVVKCNPDKLMYKLRECSDTYNFPTDGLAYYQDLNEWRRFRTWRSDEELQENFRKFMKK